MIEHLLSYLLFLPAIGGLILLLGRRNETFVKLGGIVVSAVVFVLSLILWFHYHS